MKTRHQQIVELKDLVDLLKLRLLDGDDPFELIDQLNLKLLDMLYEDY